MSVGRICTREVDLTEPNEPVQMAARRMHSRNVGTLVVCDPDKHPVGMLTDRDLAIRVVAEGHDPGNTPVADVMTKNPFCVREDAPIEMALKAMPAGPCRRVPVVDDERRLVGLVSMDDILRLLSEEFKDIGTLLEREDPSRLACT
jgi:CBS domain-containing protein